MAGNKDILNKISLYENRSIGEIINIAIDFLRQNWRTALRLSIYMLLPIALLHSTGIFTLVRSIGSEHYNSADLGFLLTSLFLFLGLGVTYTLILTLVQYYQGSEDGDLSMLTFRDMKGVLWRNFRRVMIAMLPILLLMIVCSLLLVILLFIPFGFIAYFILFFILMMIPIYYVLEHVSLGNAFSRTFSHAKESWGKLFGLMFALLLVVMIILSATSLPMTVFIFTKDTLLPSGEYGMASEMIYDTILYVFLVIETFFAYLSMALVVTAMVFHYGRNSRRHDDLALGSDIENFANL